MRTLPIAGSFLTLLAGFTAYGCALDLTGIQPGTSSAGGVDPSTSAVSGSGGTTATTTTSTTTTSSAGGAGGSTVAVTASSTGTCMPTQEVCDDGLDNDCDGDTDCADSDCSGPTDGRACVPAAPAGWTLTAVAPDAGGSCPAGYDAPVTVAAAPTSAAATCDCTCGATLSNPCTQGSLTVKSGMTCTIVTITSTVTGACDAFGTTLVGPHKSFGGPALAATPVACGVTLKKPGQVSSSAELLCAPTASAAGGCAGNQACLPKATSAKLCIQTMGDKPCPSGAPFTSRSVVGSPGDVSDQRSCGACTCMSNASTCSGCTLTAYTDVNCMMNPVSATIDGSCSAGNNGQSFQNDTHFVYQATPNVTTCSPSSAKPALTGTIEPNNPITVCCQP